MEPKKNPQRTTEDPVPEQYPEVEPLADPEETGLPGEIPDALPEEDPYENPLPYEIPEPGEGP